MKKNSILVSFTVLTFVISSFSIISAASKKINTKFIAARIIFVGDNYIELKKGNTEIKVNIDESSKYISQDGKENDKNIIKVCQYVDAYYNIREGRNNLDKLIIKTESDCKQ